MGYLRGLRHGAILGAGLGLLFAPRSGVMTRRQVSGWLAQLEGMIQGTSGPVEMDPTRESVRPRPVTGRVESRGKRP
jgi:gas vesicle protein